MKRKVIIYSNFNIPNYMNSKYLVESSKKILLEDWINSRMDIFFNYTLNGFIAQSNQDFTAIYNYTDESEDMVLKAIRTRGGLPSNVLFVPRSKYENTVDELIDGYDELYLCKLDSDDVYKNTFVEALHEYMPEDDTKVIICCNGYMYDVNNVKMAKIWHVCASFHTYIYRLKDEKVRYDSQEFTPLQFLDKSHFLPLNYKYEYFTDYCYLWVIHSDNSSTKFQIYNSNIIKTRSLLNMNEMYSVLLDFL
ncbi:MAG: hypothetical protein ACRC7N_08085 [Clostridium sp.]